MPTKILINALGISDSGGISVFSKLLEECMDETRFSFIFICHDNENIQQLVNHYKESMYITFYLIRNRGIIHRLWFENIYFKSLIKQYGIALVYNFTGSGQFFSKTPQLVKIHNLLFYSKQLDKAYFKKRQYLKWLKQIYVKRFVFLTMIRHAKYIEIQSEHVKYAIADFLTIDNKHFFIKSDIGNLYSYPKYTRQYNFKKSITFLYIVGPHFSFLHKNIIDFIEAMCILNEENIDFSIKITLTQNQLEESGLWNNKLNHRTQFLGYIKDKKEIEALFQNNTILISTSIIETLGLHVIEATLNGILTIVPNENYAKHVYGKDILHYDLFNPKSLVHKISVLLSNDPRECCAKIKKQKQYLIMNENKKMNTIFEIFNTLIRKS
jgi:glycosyltransferase involved in cell wall biosynthesis